MTLAVKYIPSSTHIMLHWPWSLNLRSKKMKRIHFQLFNRNLWNLGNYLINAPMSGVPLDEEAAELKQKFFEKFRHKFEEAVVNLESLGGMSAEQRKNFCQ